MAVGSIAIVQIEGLRGRLRALMSRTENLAAGLDGDAPATLRGAPSLPHPRLAQRRPQGVCRSLCASAPTMASTS